MDALVTRLGELFVSARDLTRVANAFFDLAEDPAFRGGRAARRASLALQG
jgi:hypothetical protein